MKRTSNNKHQTLNTMEKKMSKHGWVFVSPVVIGFVFIYFNVIGRSFLFSFQDIKPAENMFETTWVGLEHYYSALFVEVGYLRNLTELFIKMLYNVPLIIIFSLFVATLLYQRLPGKSFFRAVFFIPAVLVTGAIADSTTGNMLAGAMNELETLANGSSALDIFSLQDLQNLLGGAVLNNQLFNYLLGAINNIFSVVKQCGVQILVFIAGLQSLSPSVYEAASIEGANAWDKYWKITFPLITPMIFVNALYTVIDSFTGSSNIIMRTIYELGISQSKIGYASAYSWLYFLVIIIALVFVLIFMAFFKYQSSRGNYEN